MGERAIAIARKETRELLRDPVYLGLALLCFLVEVLFDSAIGLLPSTLSLFLGTDGIGWVLPGAVGILTQVITMPVVAAITVLIYLDLRVRTEGLDLELDALEAFPAKV